jgi:hypothetical protein
MPELMGVLEMQKWIGRTIVLLALGLIVQTTDAQTTARNTIGPLKSMRLTGRWQVKFMLAGRPESNLIFEAKKRSVGSLLLLDSGPDGKAEETPRPAAWSELTNDRVSFSGEVELPIGNCCREIGTLIFKGRFQSANTVIGKLIFVTSVDEEENPYQFRSLIGTFSATRLPN